MTVSYRAKLFKSLKSLRNTRKRILYTCHYRLVEITTSKLVGLVVWLALRDGSRRLFWDVCWGRKKGIQGNFGKGKRGGWQRRVGTKIEWPENWIAAAGDEKIPLFRGSADSASSMTLANVGYIYEKAGVNELKVFIFLSMLHFSLSRWDFRVFLQYCWYIWPSLGGTACAGFSDKQLEVSLVKYLFQALHVLQKYSFSLPPLILKLWIDRSNGSNHVMWTEPKSFLRKMSRTCYLSTIARDHWGRGSKCWQ